MVMATGQILVHPLIGAGTQLLIKPRTWRLLSHEVHVLSDGTLANVPLGKAWSDLSGVVGITPIHEFHVWAIVLSVDAIKAHVDVDDLARTPAVARSMRAPMEAGFNIEHATLRVEDDALASEAPELQI